MSTFSWLLIGHLVGDWMFQSDWMASEKHNGLRSPALLVHCTLYTLIMVGFLAIAQRQAPDFGTALQFLLLIYVSHWLIDGMQAAVLWGHLLGQTDQKFVRIVVDQTLHILVLALLVEFWL
jgi:hypothetical protein